MADKPIQKLLPFDAPPDASHAAREEPSDEVLAPFDALEDDLRDGRGKPVNDLAGEVLHFLARALLDTPPKRAYHHVAEERLEALLACPELVGLRPEEEDGFRGAVTDVPDALHERTFDRGQGR